MRRNLYVLVLLAGLSLLAPQQSQALWYCGEAAAACSSWCQIDGLGSCVSWEIDPIPPCYVTYYCWGGTLSFPCNCGGCFLAGTQISMADGTKKAIEQIQVGDEILAFDEATGQMKPDKVVDVHKPAEWDHYLIVNSRIRLTPVHPVLSEGKWPEIGQLKVGDTLMDEEGKPVLIESIERVDDKVTVYNFAVNPYHSYVADGIIVHNKPPLPIPIEAP